jgi:microcystin-dependent protein
MKKIYTLTISLLLILNLATAQVPQGFKYQTAIRDNSGALIANKLVAIKLSLLTGAANGTSVYSEVHKVATNDFGVANLNIGNGTVGFGNFSTIDWGSNTFFLKTEVDINNGTNFTFMGSSQLLSVPFALYAAKSANAADDKDKDSTNELQAITLDNNSLQLNKNGGSVDLTKYAIDNNTDSQTVSLTGNTLSITRGNFVKLNDVDSTNELQQLTLNSNNLQLNKNGGNVDLTKYDKDSQQLVLNGNTLSITKGNSIVLSGAVDLDADPTNEIQNLSLSKDTLKLSKANYVVLPKENDADSTNEIQSLSVSQNKLIISKSNQVNIDADTTNEIQSLTFRNDTLQLSKANQIIFTKDNDRDSLNELQTLSILNDSIKISKANSVYLPSMPVGSIVAYGGRSIPNGWLLCIGDTVSRTIYNKLFIAIDSVWGNGNGSTTFHLPDLRGQFLRGVSASSNVDSDTLLRTAKYIGGNTGNKVGSFQNDELKSHNHQVFTTSWNGSTGFAAGNGSGVAIGTVNSTGGAETRPKNAYVYYIIKY